MVCGMGQPVAVSTFDPSRRFCDTSDVESVNLAKEEASKYEEEFNSISLRDVYDPGCVARNVRSLSPCKKRTNRNRVSASKSRVICRHDDDRLESRCYSVSSRLAEDGDRTASICSDASAKGHACGNCDVMFCQRDRDASIAPSSDLVELKKDINEMKRIIKPSEVSRAASEHQCEEDDGGAIWPNFLQCFPTNYVGMCISWNNFQQEGVDDWDNVSEITTNKESFVWNDDYHYVKTAEKARGSSKAERKEESSNYSCSFRSRSSYSGSSSRRPPGLLSSSITSNMPKSPLRLGKTSSARTVKARKVVEGSSVLYEV